MWASTYPSQTGTALSCTPSCSRAMYRSGTVASPCSLTGGSALPGLLHLLSCPQSVKSRRSGLTHYAVNTCEVFFADTLPCKYSSVHSVGHLLLARSWPLPDMEPLP